MSSHEVKIDETSDKQCHLVPRVHLSPAESTTVRMLFSAYSIAAIP